MVAFSRWENAQDSIPSFKGTARTAASLILGHAHRLMSTDGMGALAPRNSTLLMLEQTTSPAGDLTPAFGLQVCGRQPGAGGG